LFSVVAVSAAAVLLLLMLVPLLLRQFIAYSAAGAFVAARDVNSGANLAADAAEP